MSLEKWETNTRVFCSWKDFPVCKYNGIPFDAHLALSLILIISVKFSLRNGDFYFHWKTQLLPQTYDIYSNKDDLYLGPLVEISLISQYNTFQQWILRDSTYYTFNTVYWQNIFSKTNVCICFYEIKRKTILWNKAHYANKTICHKEANKCM